MHMHGIYGMWFDMLWDTEQYLAGKDYKHCHVDKGILVTHLKRMRNSRLEKQQM
jgi:hypothetical protein